MIITIKNYKCLSLNDYFGKHWAAKAKITEIEKGLAYADAKQRINAERIIEGKFTKINKCKIIFSAYFKDKRKHDPDNLLAKNFIDGIVAAGVIPDDNDQVVIGIEKRALRGQDYNGIDIQIIQL